jgi:hypothetical protein
MKRVFLNDQFASATDDCNETTIELMRRGAFDLGPWTFAQKRISLWGIENPFFSDSRLEKRDMEVVLMSIVVCTAFAQSKKRLLKKQKKKKKKKRKLDSRFRTRSTDRSNAKVSRIEGIFYAKIRRRIGHNIELLNRTHSCWNTRLPLHIVHDEMVRRRESILTRWERACKYRRCSKSQWSR